MKCALCNGEMRKIYGQVCFEFVGVPDIEYLECKKCGGQLFDTENAIRLVLSYDLIKHHNS